MPLEWFCLKNKLKNSLTLIMKVFMAALMLLSWTALSSNQEGVCKGKKLLIAKKKKKKKKRRKKIDDPLVNVVTDKGEFLIQVFEDEAPVTSQNFLALVKQGFYNGLKFHRYDPRFVIQGGDPTGTGCGGSGKTIPLETTKALRHSEVGMVGLARKSDPNSGSSQFYIILSPRSELDDKYAVFGKVIEGLETVFQLRAGDSMKNVFLEGSDSKSK